MPHGNIRHGRSFTSIRSLMAASLMGDTMVLATVPVSGRQLDEVVQYDLNGNQIKSDDKAKNRVVILDFDKIGGLDQVLTIDAAVSLITGLVNQAIKSAKVEIPSMNIDELKILLTKQITAICDGQDTIKLETIVTAIRDTRTSSAFGKWSQLGSVPANRFVASVMGWTKGRDWVNANMKSAKTSYGEPKYAIACYGYDAEILTKTGQPLSVAIPSATPMAICVLGFYPNAQGGYDIRYVGTMPSKPMVSDELTAAPRFVRHDGGAIATRKLINVIKNGSANANELFQNPDNAGYYLFTESMLTMSHRNPTGFVRNFGLVVAYTNGHKDVVKELRSAIAATNAADAKEQEILATDFGTSTNRKTTGSPFAGAFSSTRTPQVVERELVGAGVGSAPNFGSTPSFEDAFSLEG